MALKSSNKVDTNIYELEVTVEKEEFQKAVTDSFRKNNKKIQIAGFRKGKAPRNLVEKMYGESFFWEDAINALYPKHYELAIKETDLIPVDQADIDIKDVDQDGFTFVAKVTVKPEVAVKNYKGIKAKKLIKKVTDEQIDNEISRVRDTQSRLVSVSDRPAQLGDTANINFEGFKEGVAFEGGKGEDFDLVLGSGQFIPGFEEQVVGHNVDDEFDVNLSFPEEYHVEDLKGQPVVFKVKLNEISEKELPELDDEFAKDVSEFTTFDEYKKSVAEKLQEQLDQSTDGAFEEALIDEVIANMEVEVPQVMFERRIDQMVDDFGHRLEHQGMNLKMYMQFTGTDTESFRKTFAEQAEKQVKIRLALEKIAEVENIVASEEKIGEEYDKMAEAYKMDVEEIKKYVPADEIAKDVVVNMAIDMVRDTAIAEEVNEEEFKAASQTETEEAPAKEEKPKKTRKPRAKKVVKEESSDSEEKSAKDEKGE